jgi:hypothetical protein
LRPVFLRPAFFRVVFLRADFLRAFFLRADMSFPPTFPGIGGRICARRAIPQARPAGRPPLDHRILTRADSRVNAHDSHGGVGAPG